MTEETKELATITEVTVDTAADAILHINEAFYDIPFENSAFQTDNFAIASQMTPERAYRAIGLRLSSKLRALQESKFAAMREEIDIEELQAKIDDPNTNSYDRRRAEIDIQEKLTNRPFTQKLIRDAVVECNLLYVHFNKLPKYTRAEFEAGENTHFRMRLNRAVAGVQGAQESLVNMDTDCGALLRFEEETVQLMLQQQAAQAALTNNPPA